MRTFVLGLGLVSACGFSPRASTSGDGGPLDDGAQLDASVVAVDALLGDAPAACSLWHPAHFMPCDLGSPMSPSALPSSGSPYTYDTTNQGGDLTDKNGTLIVHSPITITQSDTTTVAILYVESFALPSGSLLKVIGPRPLIIASFDAIDIDGDVDAGSHTVPAQAGAGAATNCTNAATSGQDALSSGGSGGGGGGAFHGGGGNGAVGDMCGSGCPRTGGTGGTAVLTLPATIHGGCPGASSGAYNGGGSAAANTRAKGGAGGGAVELAARGAIHVTGTVRAGGAAGAGAPTGSAVGGGGGGAGGYIGFDTTALTISGIVATNGAGGGGSAPFSGTGNVGTDGQPSASAAAGGAANGGTCGLPGAAGSSTTLNGVTATGNDNCGGGGGGGGGGWVIARTTNPTTSGSTISPQLTLQ